MDPDLVRTFTAEFHREVNRLPGDESRRQSEAVRNLAQVTRKLESRVDAIADGLRAPGLHRKLDELQGRKVELEQAVAAPSPAVLLHPNLAEHYRQKVEALHEALGDAATRPEALEILRALIERNRDSFRGERRRDRAGRRDRAHGRVREQ